MLAGTWSPEPSPAPGADADGTAPAEDPRRSLTLPGHGARPPLRPAARPSDGTTAPRVRVDVRAAPFAASGLTTSRRLTGGPSHNARDVKPGLLLLLLNISGPCSSAVPRLSVISRGESRRVAFTDVLPRC